MKSPLIVSLFAALLPAFASAETPAIQAPPPAILQNIGIDQHLNSPLPLNLIFHDESANPIPLSSCFNSKPVILVLVYYDCPMLCTMVLNDLLRTLRSMPESVGKDFDIVTVSFDPRDTPALARSKKKTYLAQYNRPTAEAGWHFLTGDPASIKALTNAVGFHYVWDEKSRTFAHASGIMVVTPTGTLARYFFGIDYAPKDLRLALSEASNNKTGGVATAVLLYCFSYDPTTGKYGLAISRLLNVGGVATVLLIAGFIGLNLLRESRSRRQTAPKHQPRSAQH